MKRVWTYGSVKVSSEPAPEILIVPVAVGFTAQARETAVYACSVLDGQSAGPLVPNVDNTCVSPFRGCAGNRHPAGRTNGRPDGDGGGVKLSIVFDNEAAGAAVTDVEGLAACPFGAVSGHESIPLRPGRISQIGGSAFDRNAVRDGQTSFSPETGAEVPSVRADGQRPAVSEREDVLRAVYRVELEVDVEDCAVGSDRAVAVKIFEGRVERLCVDAASVFHRQCAGTFAPDEKAVGGPLGTRSRHGCLSVRTGEVAEVSAGARHRDALGYGQCTDSSIAGAEIVSGAAYR